MHTHRLGGHYEGDAQPYRDAQNSRTGGRRTTRSHGCDRRWSKPRRAIGPLTLEAAETEMDAAVQSALAAPYPDPSTVLEYVGV